MTMGLLHFTTPEPWVVGDGACWLGEVVYARIAALPDRWRVTSQITKWMQMGSLDGVVVSAAVAAMHHKCTTIMYYSPLPCCVANNDNDAIALYTETM